MTLLDLVSGYKHFGKNKKHTSASQHPEEAGSRFLQKVGTHMQDHN
jgi:hypothetical protein